MEFRDVFKRVQSRIKKSQAELARGSEIAGDMMQLLLDVRDEAIEKAFSLARERRAPEISDLPADFQLRTSHFVRRMYENMFPVSHVFRVRARYNREFLDDFMPVSNAAFIGRGSYKFVYSLPWQMVLKVSKEVLPSDPLFGSLYRQVDGAMATFLHAEELQLLEILDRQTRNYKKERLRFKFARLGLERFHYWKVKEALPELVIPTKFFMGMRYRKKFLRQGHSEKLTPMDSQIMLVGKHLKEFARAGSQSHQNRFFRAISPRFDFVFDSQRFGQIKKKVLLKIKEDFRTLIRFTELLALREKLILDIHTENIIITLPDFQLKIFDFHLFDDHLYEPSLKFDSPEKDHIEIIEKFVESFHLAD